MGHPRIAREVSHGRRALEKDGTRPNPLIAVMNYGRMCRIVRFSLARYILIQISMTPSDMGDGLIIVSKRSNGTSLC
jgi:hypothetical protein